VTPEGRESVDTQVERAAVALDDAATAAPDDAGRIATSTTAASLRALLFATEAERLLRESEQPPTGEQLTQADQACRSRSSECDAALDRLQAQVEPADAAATESP